MTERLFAHLHEFTESTLDSPPDGVGWFFVSAVAATEIETELFAKPEPMAAMCADPPAGCTLFTLPEFGCVMWEEKT